MTTIKALFWRCWYRLFPVPSLLTKEEALKIAKAHRLETEVLKAMQHGCTPDEALQEWDIYPTDTASQ